MDKAGTTYDTSGSEDEMARAGGRQVDQLKVAEIADRLRLSIANAAVFQAAIDELERDQSVTAPEVIEIAYRLLGGMRPKSRKSALTAIAQERLRLAHARSKGDAAKIRVW